MDEQSGGWFGRAPTTFKVVTISACGLLIGWGLCGMDSHLYPDAGFGGGSYLALLGAVFFVLSAIGLGFAILVWLVIAVSHLFPK